MDLTYEQQVELREIVDNYNAVGEFVSSHKKLTYVQFDYALARDLTLFMIQPDFSFEALEIKLNNVVKALPAIKRIFAQPCIHLKEHDEVLPIESVRIINNNTIQHVSSHSELWSDIKDEEIVPSKLLTRTYEDNYGIYENLVFCQTIDDILSFARVNTRFLKEFIYTNRTIEINLLERVNHLNYFLALGKLHISYSRNFEAYYPVSMRCLNILQFLTNSIVPRLKRPVYKNNRARPAQIKIRKTNILSMHKQYHQIYKLAKNFSDGRVETQREISDKDLARLEKNYFYFCEALCIFSAGHFNFAFKEDKQLNFPSLNMTFQFKKWKARLQKIKCDEVPVLALTTTKDAEYKVLIIPSTGKEYGALLERVKSSVQADEYLVFTPYESLDEGDDTVFVDITSIESFRRIQQILLRAMIYADGEHADCPFCNNTLSLNERKSTPDSPVYECFSCRTEISIRTCPERGKRYAYTRIAGLNKPEISDDDEWLIKRKLEAQAYFRNITKLTDDMEIICPVCHKVHNI